MNTKLQRGNWLVTVSLAAATAVYFVLVFLPGRKTIAQLEADVMQKQGVVAQGTGLAAALASSDKELAATRAYNAAWKQRGPSEKELHALYAQISDLAKAAGTATTHFDPKPIEEFKRLREIPLAMGCTGTFRQVCDFLRKLEGLSMVIWVDSLDLKPVREAGEAVLCEINLIVLADNSNSSD
jgi:Tfp pilus assembly protein PilO